MFARFSLTAIYLSTHIQFFSWNSFLFSILYDVFAAFQIFWNCYGRTYFTWNVVWFPSQKRQKDLQLGGGSTTTACNKVRNWKSKRKRRKQNRSAIYRKYMAKIVIDYCSCSMQIEVDEKKTQTITDSHIFHIFSFVWR